MIAALILSTTLNPGLELTEQVRDTFRLSNGYYREQVGGDAPAFNWPLGVALTMLAAAAEEDAKFKPALVEFVDKAHDYWNDKGPVPGYDVLPAPKPVDRYYDDNAWMVMALVETYEATKDKKYIKWAEETMHFVMSGEDKVLGGGIYWRESDKASKNTCINAPAAAAQMALYDLDKKPERLAAAKRLYQWTYEKLRDPQDGLMWDNMSNNGNIGKAKWSYNTGLMIRAASALYAATKETRYRDEAEAFSRASVKHWLKADGTMSCEGKFAHLLVEGWRFREAHAPTNWKVSDAQYSSIKTALLGSLRAPNGWYGSRWDRVPKEAIEKPALIDQASAARMLLVLDR